MRIPCEVIEDLLVLYDDNACSEESKRLVEKHMKECSECAHYFKKMYNTKETIVIEPLQEDVEEAKVFKSGFSKIQKRWRRTWISTIVTFSLTLGILLLSVNEVRGEGIAFSNLDDIYRCWKYLHHVKSKSFEEAADIVDYSHIEYEWCEVTKNMTQVEFEQYMKNRLIEELTEYNELGIYIDNIRFHNAHKNGDIWSVEFAVDENYPDGSEKVLFPSMSKLSMNQAGLSYYPDSGAPYFQNICMTPLVEDYFGEFARRETSFILEKGEKAIVTWGTIEMSQDELLKVDLSHKGAEIILNVQEQYFAGEAIEVVVPGEYALTVMDREYNERGLKEAEFSVEIISYDDDK